MALSKVVLASVIAAVTIGASFGLYLYYLGGWGHPALAPQGCRALECGGPGLAFTPPAVRSLGTEEWFNFSVSSANGGIAWSDVAFQVQDRNNSYVVPPSSWTLTVVDLGGQMVGSYSWNTTAWSPTQPGNIVNTQMIVWETGAGSGATVRGGTFTVLGVGSFSGSVSEAIP